MELTVHGAERTLGRTKMRFNDVLSVIMGGAAIKLGSYKGRTYFLFYSPFDRCTKVAVVSESLSVVISVLEKDYSLPRGVQRVTKMLEIKARFALKDFLFARLKEAKTKESLSVTIRVYVGKKSEYQCDGGHIPTADTQTVDAVLKVLMPTLIPIAALIEKNKGMTKGRIRYLIRLSDVETLIAVKDYFVRHEKIIERMTQQPVG